MEKGLTKRLAQYVVETDYETLPAEVIHAAKRCLIDWLGVALGDRLIRASTACFRSLKG